QDVPELSSAGGQLRLRMRKGPWLRADPVQRSGDPSAPAGRRSLREEVAARALSNGAAGGVQMLAVAGNQYTTRRVAMKSKRIPAVVITGVSLAVLSARRVGRQGHSAQNTARHPS